MLLLPRKGSCVTMSPTILMSSQAWSLGSRPSLSHAGRRIWGENEVRLGRASNIIVMTRPDQLRTFPFTSMRSCSRKSRRPNLCRHRMMDMWQQMFPVLSRPWLWRWLSPNTPIGWDEDISGIGYRLNSSRLWRWLERRVPRVPKIALWRINLLNSQGYLLTLEHEKKLLR